MPAPPTQQLPLDSIECALIALLAAEVEPVSVESLADNDFNEDGDLVMQLPAVRVRFNAAGYTKQDIYRLTYQVTPQFDFLCADQNLRSEAAQAQASLVLARKVIAAIAGQRLALNTGYTTTPVNVLGVGRFKDDEAGMVYVVSVSIEDFAQYPAPGGD